jgi:hypothetical protein
MRISFHALTAATALLSFVITIACSSPESPAAGTAPAPAANPAGTPSSPAGPRTIEGYGEVPTLSAEQASSLSDVERDLQNVMARRTNASQELSDDIAGLAEDTVPAARPAIEALVGELSAVLPDTKDGATLSRRLAELLFVASRRGALPPARVAQLQTDAQELLLRHGVPDARAKTIAGHLGTLARSAR